MNLNSIKTIHFVGIGGIGISAVAKLMILEEKRVSGSDALESETLDELRNFRLRQGCGGQGGAKIFVGHNERNVPDDAGLLVYSSAVPDSNPERKMAKNKNIPELSYFELLGEISKTKKTIAIAGTHGKSTTTAMLGLIFEAGGMDPTVIVGSKVENFPHQNLRFGKSELLVVEACEHFKNFLHLHPYYLIINNIELDHTDFYKDLSDIENAFVELAQKIPDDGFILFNNDNQGAMNVYKKLNSKKCKETRSPGETGSRYNPKMETFCITSNTDWSAYNISSSEGEQKFKIRKNNQSVGEFTLRVPGRFNIYNALAASALAMNIGVSSGVIKKVLADFSGIWRRFEKVGEINCRASGALQTPEAAKSVIVISDYGHHPTEVKETLKAARDFYPLRRIVLAFQPHQHNRTKNLFDGFVEALSETDVLILSEIFDVTGREEMADQRINSHSLLEAMRKKYPEKNKNLIYGGNLEKTTETILKNLQPNDLLIIMGAGDIYTIIPQIVQK